MWIQDVAGSHAWLSRLKTIPFGEVNEMLAANPPAVICTRT